VSQLLEELEALIKKIVNLHSQNSEEEIIHVVFVEHKLLQRKVDTQLCSTKSRKKLSQIGDKEHKKLREKHVSNKEAWRSALLLNGWKQHKFTLNVQLQSMLNANQRPTFAPLMLHFLGLEGEDDIDHRCVLWIVPCPFCHKPTWDGKIASCKHVYH